MLQLNGALTIGTMDGANVEMAEEMGEENMFIFGMNVDEVERLQCSGYEAEDYVNSNVELAEVMEQLKSGFFSDGDASEFQDIVDNLLKHDRFYTLADYDAYMLAQDHVNETYRVRNITYSINYLLRYFILSISYTRLYQNNDNLFFRILHCGQKCPS